MTKVFISSTVYDLVDARAEIKDYLEKLGMVPVLSDHPDSDFKTFGDENSIDTCVINLRRIDIVVLILSQRNGAVVGPSEYEIYSATHL